MGPRRRRSGVFGALLAAVLLCACGPTDLPRATRVYATTQVTDATGTAIGLGTQNDFMQALSAPQPGGLALKPGDVLYVRRWSAGNRIGNPLSPAHFIDRIPLRLVGTAARLTDAEEAFLLNAIVTNRADYVLEHPALAAAIRDRRLAMWNGLVQSLRVKRIVRNSNEPVRLIATVNLQKVLGPEFPDPAYIGKREDAGIDGIDIPLLSPPDALTAVQGSSAKNAQYYLPVPKQESVLFTFVSAELGGVDIGRPGHEESQWTLRELQESEICRVEIHGRSVLPTIAAVSVPASFKRFWFHKTPVTHEVLRVLTPDTRSRRLRPLGMVSWLYTYVLPESALDELSVTDVSRIFWRTEHGAISGPAHCQPHGGRR